MHVLFKLFKNVMLLIICLCKFMFKICTYKPIYLLYLKLIDDTMYERMEQFDLELSDPSIPASLGAVTTSLVVIDGPNDSGYYFLVQKLKQKNDSWNFP